MESFVLALILSLDAFAASLAYGADSIRIPRASAVIISGICSGLLAASLLVGDLVAPLLSWALCLYISSGILLVLGAVKLFDSTVKQLISRTRRRKIAFRLFSVNFILQVYADPAQADSDRSRVLSAREAVSLAVAMSLDGLTIGFGAGLGSISIWLTFVLSFAVTLAAVGLGAALGARLSGRLGRNLGWISGVTLIVMALWKLAA